MKDSRDAVSQEAVSDVFVFSSKAESSPKVRPTARSAPVTPRIPVSDSSDVDVIKTPQSASGVPYDFKIVMSEDGVDGLPLKFDFTSPTSPMQGSVLLGSKRTAKFDEISVSPKIGPKIKASSNFNELGDFSNGHLTPVSGVLTSDRLSQNEASPSSCATPATTVSSSSYESGHSMNITTPLSSITSPRSPSDSSQATENSTSIGHTPESVVEELDQKELQGSSGISDDEAVSVAKRSLQFATMSNEKSSVPVVVTWISSPHSFIVSRY